MGIKKQLGLGVASAALGLSLVGGGTWAAFNDVETMQNSLTAGVLDLEIDKPVDGAFTVSKLVPGDTITREFEIMNNGNVDINEVLLATSVTFDAGNGVDDNNPNTSVDEYLKQFKINVYSSDSRDLLADIASSNNSYKTLYDFVMATQDADNFDIASGDGFNNKGADFNGKDSDTITIELEFIDDKSTDSNGEYIQNKFMGNSMDLNFTFEATQKPGTARSND